MAVRPQFPRGGTATEKAEYFRAHGTEKTTGHRCLDPCTICGGSIRNRFEIFEVNNWRACKSCVENYAPIADETPPVDRLDRQDELGDLRRSQGALGLLVVCRLNEMEKLILENRKMLQLLLNELGVNRKQISEHLKWDCRRCDGAEIERAKAGYEPCKHGCHCANPEQGCDIHISRWRRLTASEWACVLRAGLACSEQNEFDLSDLATKGYPYPINLEEQT